jgi:hydroxypyruvate isomerase
MTMTAIDRRAFIAGAGALAATGAHAVAQDRPVAPIQPATRPDDWVDEPGRTKNTRFAVNVEMWNFGGKSFLDRIRASADLGFDAVEFWGLGGKDLEATAKLCQDLKVEIAQFTAWGFNPGMNNPKNHEAFVKAIHKATEAAAILKARKATVVAGNNQKGMTQEEMLQSVTDGLTLAAPIAEAANLMLILEPMNGRVDHPGHCLYGSVDAVKICREVDSPMVKINWDLYHMQISEGDLCGRMRDGFDQIGYLQLADHPGRNEPMTGEIRYQRVLEEAKRLGYDDIVGLECRPREDAELAAQRVNQVDRW